MSPTFFFSVDSKKKRADSLPETSGTGHSHHILTIKSGLVDAVVAGWIAVTSLDDLAKVDLPADSVCTVYTTALLPDSWVKERQPTIVPCYRLWDNKGEAVKTVIAYRM